MDEETLLQLPIVSGDPGYHTNLSKVPSCLLVALVVTIVCYWSHHSFTHLTCYQLQACYEEWWSGSFSQVNLSTSAYSTQYNAMYDLIYSEWSHQLRWDAICKRFASWAWTSMYVYLCSKASLTDTSVLSSLSCKSTTWSSSDSLPLHRFILPSLPSFPHSCVVFPSFPYSLVLSPLSHFPSHTFPLLYLYLNGYSAM